MHHRIAIIYDKTLRPETTGTYCLRALSDLAEVVYFSPNELDAIPRTGFDFYLSIDDGLRYRLPKDLRPCAWWAIDTHMDLPWAIERGRDFDWLFAAQRDGANQLNQSGLSTTWLPLACDPTIHRPWPAANRWDVCFVGRIAPGPRQELLSRISHEFPRSFIGECFFDEYAQTCSASSIGFNRSVKNDVNMRVFETLACGPLLVTNDLAENGQNDLFQPDEHLVTYATEDELVDKLRFYLREESSRRRIARAGHAEALSRHTYHHRMQQLLVSVGAALNRVSIAVGSVPTAPQNAATPNWIDTIDFGIKTFLRPVALLRLLRSIRTFYPAARITVVDDGDLRCGRDAASLACCAILEERPADSLCELPFASGVSAGRNELVERTTRPFLLILDDDFELTSATDIQRLWNRLQVDASVGLVAGACIDLVGEQRRLRNSGGTFRLIDGVLEIQTQQWKDEKAGLRDYVPQFALIRREVFQDVRWDGGVGAEHYDFFLQLLRTKWKVAQDVSVRIDHHPGTESLTGYEAHRFNYAEAQQWLLRKWGLQKVLQDGQPIIELPATTPSKSVAAGGLSDLMPDKDSLYFEFSRPEVIALIPERARRVLDIGCGAGRLGEALKQRQPAAVSGLELQPRAVTMARRRLDHVIEGNVEDPAIDFPDESFDCIVCADVIEHLRSPAAVLTKIRRWLTSDGVLVFSLPNVRHHSVVDGLLNGNWTYEAAGLLDDDHARFFTRREIEKLLYRTNFLCESFTSVPGPGHAAWVSAGRPGSVRIGGLTIEGMAPDEAEEFFTYQYLGLARPVRSPDFGLTSIVIVTFNEFPYTKECIDSIRLRTDEPYELIFVDNGSTDGTADYLESLSGVKLIRNPDNKGFPAAANQGIKAAQGNQVLLLNNDTVVTTGWLRRLLNALHSSSTIGMVGPCSNQVSGPQMIPVSYTDMSSMDGFAWDHGKRHVRLYEETDRLIGFCLLIRKAVIEQIGCLDERFGIGCFEDDDICLRAMRAGWHLLIARESFVHHYGSRTFAAVGVDYAQLIRSNQQRFQDKWKTSIANERGDTAGARSSAEKPAARPKVSLCMIVRNNEHTIGPCLESIRPWVDEMIVVDTGSTDRTPALCEELGAMVYHWAWRDDFSAARNESVEYATGEWIFWMDSDDTITLECGRRLRLLADGVHQPNTLGYIMQVHCPGPGSDTHDVTAVDHVKLFRNDPALRFEHRIHEQILPAIRRAGGEVVFTDIYVTHSGADHSVEGRRRKLERDFKLLTLDLAERPDHPFVLFNLGMTHADVNQHDEAVGWLTRCLEVSHPHESHVRKAYALLISSLMQLADHDRATLACRRALELYPEDKEILFRRAMLAHKIGHLQTAADLYHQVLIPDRDRYFTSIDLGLSGFKARHNLALVYEDLDQMELAESQWRTILIEQPSYLPARLGIIDCLLRRRADKEAVSHIEILKSDPQTAPEGVRMAARLAESRGEIARAISELEHGLQQHQDDVSLLRELARLLHSEQRNPSALQILERLTELKPDDASAWHNRGFILGLLGRADESTLAFSQAGALRSNGHEVV